MSLSRIRKDVDEVPVPCTKYVRVSHQRRKATALLLCASAAACVLMEEQSESAPTERTEWTKSYIRNRAAQGCYDNLMRELALKDEEGFRRWIRMDTTTFDWLLKKVDPLIRKNDTNMRESIDPGVKLSTALRYLATGETQMSLHYQFRVAQSTISKFLPSVLQATYDVLCDEYLKIPNGEEWFHIGNRFWELWNFPSCIGALDGKHIDIIKPPNSGSVYFNYKGRFSIVLMAAVDADLRFIYVDVGKNGRVSDGGVWANCKLKEALDRNLLDIPREWTLPGTSVKVPSVFVADDAFPLTQNIMKPYPGRHINTEEQQFNYRLSRARRVAENAFGILAARFRVFQAPINLSPKKAELVVLAACAVHNLLRTKTPAVYTPSGSLDSEDIHQRRLNGGYWRNAPDCSIPLETSRQRGNDAAKQIRNIYRNFFTTVGRVPWQEKMADQH